MSVKAVSVYDFECDVCSTKARVTTNVRNPLPTNWTKGSAPFEDGPHVRMIDTHYCETCTKTRDEPDDS
jgi:hypothetical protein